MNLLFILEKSFVVIYHLYIPRGLICFWLGCLYENKQLHFSVERDRRPFRYLESHRDRFQKILDIQ